MFLRNQTVRSGGRAYSYTQIVESYRNARGKPTQRILASFKELPDALVENLKLALEASRQGRSVVLAEAVQAVTLPEILDNLGYLDAAVCLRLWHEAGLSTLLDDVLPPRHSDGPTSRVIAALTLHRLLDPGSKLSASRWYPHTALAELQGLTPGQLNNTRIHRALEDLERAEEALQQRVPRLVRSLRKHAFIALFADLTDTTFVGRGPDMAHKTRTKDGRLERRIGVGLVAQDEGLPIIWDTLPGSYHDPWALRELVNRLRHHDWVADTPVVMDRALGRASSVAWLAESGLRFLTAIPVDEFASYTNRIPWTAFEKLTSSGHGQTHQQELRAVEAAAEAAGLHRIRDNRWLLDLGVVRKGEHLPLNASPKPGATPLAHALRAAIDMQTARESGAVRRQSQLARQNGIAVRGVQRYLGLTRLVPEIQTRILAGEAEVLSFKQLGDLAKLTPQAQPSAFEALLAQRTAAKNRGGRRPKLGHSSPAAPSAPLRLVVHFNPQRFLDDRAVAQQQLDDVEDLLRKLNLALASSSRRTEASILAEVSLKLSHRKLQSVFNVTVKRLDTPTGGWKVRLDLDEEEWRRRRRWDGFNLLVAHPEMPHSGADLIELYFAKDAIEKDFQTIKSELELRPVWHRTDHKVRAHVILCVFALLVERLLEQRLRSSGLHLSAPACLEILRTCHLNRIAAPWGTAYALTQPSADQMAIIKALGLDALLDDHEVQQALTPR